MRGPVTMQQEESAGGGVELDGAINSAPDLIGWSAIEDDDVADFAAVVGGVDQARAPHTEKTLPIVVAVDLEIEELATACGGAMVERSPSLPASWENGQGGVRRSRGHLVNVIVGERVKEGQIEDEVVVCVSGVLDGAQDGVCVAVEQHIEGMKVGVALVAEGENDDEDRKKGVRRRGLR